MTKKLISIFLLVLGAVGIFIYLNFGDLAKRATEKIASDALGVKVRISSLDISLQDKKVAVNGLLISNPPGYKNAHAMSAKTITIGLNTASKKLIDFKKINVEGVAVNLEVTQKGNNLTDLKKLAAAKPQKESVGSKQIRVIIQNMVIGASTLNPSVTLLGGSLGSIKIPSINLSGIGRRENGILAKDAITQVITKYISVAEKKADRAGFLKGTGEVEKAVGQAKKDFKKLGKDIGGLFGN